VRQRRAAQTAQTRDGEAAKALLTIMCGLQEPAGSVNPLAGRSFVLMKWSLNEYLKQHHVFEGPPETDVTGKMILAAATSVPPLCRESH
jgi:hypothetical protein